MAPTSTASTAWAAGLKAKRDGDLPPLEFASPAGPTSPEWIRASIRDATVERASPVLNASSARPGLAGPQELEEIAGARQAAAVVRLVIEIVETLDVSSFRSVAAAGRGRRSGILSAMLLGLLVYAYCRGVRSSRQVERLCHTDIAFKVPCAGDVPDHATIARFRAVSEEAFAGLFAQAGLIAARAGLARLQASQAGQPVRGRIPDGPLRLAEARAHLERELRDHQAKLDRRAALVAAGKKPMGAPPVPTEEHSRIIRARRVVAAVEAAAASDGQAPTRSLSKAVANTTDPESRVMPTRRGFVQGYKRAGRRHR